MEKSKGFKVTYSTLDPEGMKAFHRSYDQAVKEVTRQFGKSHPLFISGREVRTAEEFADTSPINSELLIGKFQKGTAAELDAAVDAAFKAFKPWRDIGYEERCHKMRKAAELIGSCCWNECWCLDCRK